MKMRKNRKITARNPYRRFSALMAEFLWSIKDQRPTSITVKRRGRMIVHSSLGYEPIRARRKSDA